MSGKTGNLEPELTKDEPIDVLVLTPYLGGSDTRFSYGPHIEPELLFRGEVSGRRDREYEKELRKALDRSSVGTKWETDRVKRARLHAPKAGDPKSQMVEQIMERITDHDYEGREYRQHVPFTLDDYKKQFATFDQRTLTQHLRDTNASLEYHYTHDKDPDAIKFQTAIKSLVEEALARFG